MLDRRVAHSSLRASLLSQISVRTWCLKRASVETSHKSCGDEETDATEQRQDLQGEAAELQADHLTLGREKFATSSARVSAVHTRC